ncbi:MFS transporter [Gammaproteobacteria bacterium]|nr:MFS transporter [Gammaproteobacteria bacterium]
MRICGPWVAIWFTLFAIPLFVFIPDVPLSNLTIKQSVRKGLSDLGSTLKYLPKEKNIFLYLLAHLIYIDGLNTLFAFGGIYAAGTFHMNLSEVLLFGIMMTLSAGIGAMIFAWVDDYLGSKLTIMISLIFLIFFGLMILFIKAKLMFWIAGIVLTFFVGPVQAASRSFMAHLVPFEKSTEFFGLYAFSGRVTAFLGPWILGGMTLYFHSQRAGMASIVAFFIVGGAIMCFVKEPNRLFSSGL